MSTVASNTGYITVTGGSTGTISTWITSPNIVTNTASVSVWQDYTNIAIREVEAPTLLQKNSAYKMPNGSRVIIDNDGGFTVDDKDAKVIYRANRVYDFNPFLNASDLMEEYIKELVPHGVRQDQVLKIPIESFIYWLVHKAAEKDNDPTPKDIPRLPSIVGISGGIHRLDRCGGCGRFIKRAHAAMQIYFCSPEHMLQKLKRIENATSNG